jgi:putative restriction endonuclease
MSSHPDRDISVAIEALYALHVGVIGKGSERHERPHKPLLLLTVLDLIAQGKATPERVPWSQDLRSRFAIYFDHVRQRDDQCSPENPFFYLRQEQWWSPRRITDRGVLPLEAPPLAGDAAAGTVLATLAAPLALWTTSSTDRLRLRDALIARYFPHARSALSTHFREGTIQDIVEEPVLKDDDSKPQPGRSCGFRRVIQEVYDYQCAACGLRIRIPQFEDLTFIDAAHLIPFGDPNMGGNDHPTNGIALCKNHHWAMDQFLIAPARDFRWRVSPLVEARRSSGEAELRDLRDQPLLLPADEAFHPSQEGLAWREERLAA